jgi:hypothetical protein
LRGVPSPDHVRYLDLMRSSGVVPDGVVEMGGAPLAYTLDATNVAAPEIESLQHSLVFRGDAPYLAAVTPGKLVVYSLGSEVLEGNKPKALLTVKSDAPPASTTFQRLFHSTDLDAVGQSSQTVHARLFDLLGGTVEDLQGLGLENPDAVSLAGRAMFTRFLVDRQIVTQADWARIAPHTSGHEEFFSSARNAASTCKWLDTTFNGDFLPLSFRPTRQELAKFPPRLFQLLSDVMRCRRNGQLCFKWDNIDMSKVPAGLLSQVYEHQANKWNPYSRHQTGVYYTPKRIAEYMVAEVMASIRSDAPDRLKSVRILDPAAGGGVFLVAFFRELVAERWRQLDRPPSSREIREILYSQIAGFDISEPALRLTALSLYLTALELDTNPQPLSELQFEPLRKRVLFDTKEPGAVGGGVVLGSLRAMSEHRGRYDVVVANPPWTALQSASAARRVEEELGKAEVAPSSIRLPDKVPDLAFLLFAKSWARADGWIAMALHARLLFKQSKPGIEARNLVFKSLDVKGILNGAELRATEVWPGVSAPFCILFARNRVPSPRSLMFFVSPYEERAMNSQGRFRVDSQSSHPVAVLEAAKDPCLFKSLFRGTALDLALLRRLRSSFGTLQAYWASADLASGEGYQVGTSEAEDASLLIGRPDLGSDQIRTAVVSVSGLRRFSAKRLHRVRHPGIYQAPLILVRKSPPSNGSAHRGCFLSWDDVIFSESIYGWSAAGHKDAKRLAKYLFVLLNSSLMKWHALVTSGQFGVERDSLHKMDIESMPMRPLEQVPAPTLARLDVVFDSLTAKVPSAASAAEVAASVDAFVAAAYDLSKQDSEVMADTLSTRLPFRSVANAADAPPMPAAVEAFRRRIEECICAAIRKRMTVSLEKDSGPWHVLRIGPGERVGGAVLDRAALTNFAALSNETTRIVWRQKGSADLIIMILRQARYFTLSRARLLALETLQQHADLWS